MLREREKQKRKTISRTQFSHFKSSRKYFVTRLIMQSMWFRITLRQPTALKENQTKDRLKLNEPQRRWGEGAITKSGWKPCRTVPWHLCPGCCLFWTAQRQIDLLDRDYWPLGHYHLHFPWCIPVNREQCIEVNNYKVQHAEKETEGEQGRLWNRWMWKEKKVKRGHTGTLCLCKSNKHTVFLMHVSRDLFFAL